MFATSTQGGNPESLSTYLDNTTAEEKHNQAKSTQSFPLSLRPLPTPETCAFAKVINKAQELATTHLSARGFRLGSQEGKNDHKGRSYIMRPSASDFLCDVTLAARPHSGLTSTETNRLHPAPQLQDKKDFEHFQGVYFKEMVSIADPNDSTDWQDGEDRYFSKFLREVVKDAEDWAAVMERDSRVRQTVGARFMDLGLFPVENYFAAVDVRRRNDEDEFFVGLQVKKVKKAKKGKREEVLFAS